MLTNVPWLTILQLGAVTAVLTQLLGSLIDFAKNRFANRREARTLALLIAVSLEKFAIDCADVIASNDLFRSTHGHAGRTVGAIPEAPELLPSLDWKVLDPKLAERAASMRNERLLGEGRIQFAWEIAGERDDMYGATDIECGRCGHIAWTTARDLRAYHRVPPIDVERLSWNFTPILQEKYDYAMRLIAKRNARDG